MKIRTKVEIIGGYLNKYPISFTLNDVTVNFLTLNEKNYVEATQQVTGCQDAINGGLEKTFEYEYNQERLLLTTLRRIESIGSFLLGIQEIRYDERETDWIAENDGDTVVADRLSKSKWNIEKDNTKIEISEDKIEQLITSCSTITDELFAFEFLRQGNVSFRKDNYYIAFINYFMLLEEAFGKGQFQKKQLENNFSQSQILHLCVLSAIDMLRRNPLDLLYVEWMQNEVKRRQMEWGLSGVLCCIVRFRGDYLHSHKRAQILGQREHFFKHIAAFTQAICWAYCSFLIISSNMTENEKTNYINEEIEKIKTVFELTESQISKSRLE